MQNLGDAAHADSADADEMDGAGIVGHHGHRALSPASARTASSSRSTASGLARAASPTSHRRQTLGLAHQHFQLARQTLGREVLLRHQHGSASVSQGACVRVLVVVGSIQVGHQDRRAGQRQQLGHRRGAGAGDQEIGRGHARRHISEKTGEFGSETVRRVGSAHPLEILWPTLLRQIEPLTQLLRQQRYGRRHHVAEYTRSLAAAQDQNPEVVLGSRRRGQVRELGARRVAGEQPLLAGMGWYVRGRLEAQGHGAREAGGQPVGPPEHGVLLVHEQRHPAYRRGQGGRHRGVSAEGRGRGRADSAQGEQTVAQAASKLAQTAQTLQQAPRRAASGDHGERQLAADVAGAARVGHQPNVAAATL